MTDELQSTPPELPKPQKDVRGYSLFPGDNVMYSVKRSTYIEHCVGTYEGHGPDGTKSIRVRERIGPSGKEVFMAKPYREFHIQSPVFLLP